MKCIRINDYYHSKKDCRRRNHANKCLTAWATKRPIYMLMQVSSYFLFIFLKLNLNRIVVYSHLYHIFFFIGWLKWKPVERQPLSTPFLPQKKVLSPKNVLFIYLFIFKGRKGSSKCHFFLPPAWTPETWVAWASGGAFPASLSLEIIHRYSCCVWLKV